MERIRNYLALFVIVQFLIFLPVISAYPQRDAKPMGWWQFDEGAGSNVSDASGNGNHGRITGAEWFKDEYGSALMFDGQDDCVWCDEQENSLSPNSALSIQAWVRPTEFRDYAFIVDHGSGWGERNQGYRLLLYNGAPRFMLTTSERVYNISSSTRLEMGQWTHLAVTYDGEAIKIYINGSLDRPHAAEGTISYTNIDFFTIGAESGSTAFHGMIDEVKVFAYARTPEQIAADYSLLSRRILTPEALARYLSSRLERFTLAQVPQKPRSKDYHTTLLASFDSDQKNDADYARYHNLASGGPTNTNAQGKFGLGVRVLRNRVPVIYPGASNCSMDKGTAEFWIRSPKDENIWNDDEDYYILTIFSEHYIGYPDRPGWSLVLRKNGATKALEFVAHAKDTYWYSHINAKTLCATTSNRLILPASSLSPEDWHHVTVSWDRADDGQIWLSVNGEGVTVAIDPPLSDGVLRPCKKIYLGGAYFADLIPTANAVFDDFRISDLSVRDQAVEKLEQRLDISQELLLKADDLCRQWFDFAATLQVQGGWQCHYEWPGLIPTEAPGTYSVLAEDEYTVRYTMPGFLRAYEVLRDERYLRAAEMAGQLLLQVQDPNGAWCQGYIAMPDGLFPVSPGNASIEEGTQTDPIRFLAYLYRVTGKEAYLEGCRKGGELVLAAQNSEGSWPLSFNSSSMTRPGGSYSGHGTLNDGTTNWGMRTMLIMYQMTGEEKYLDAIRKAGDWLVRVQAGPPTYGWAEQYTPDDQPAWARDWEPPASCTTALLYAAQGLFLMYDVTGDEKYLEPLRKYLGWAKSLPENKLGWRNYDFETGEPIVAFNRRMIVVDSPEYEKLIESGVRINYPRGGNRVQFLQNSLEARREGALIPSWNGAISRTHVVKRAVSTAELNRLLSERTVQAIASLGKLENWRDGRLQSGGILENMSRSGPTLTVGKGCNFAFDVLDLLQIAQAAIGETQPESIPLYKDRYFGYIDPERDWYNTPLMKSHTPAE